MTTFYLQQSAALKHKGHWSKGHLHVGGNRGYGTLPWPAAGTRRWFSPLRGNTSSALRGSESCRCRWGTCGGFPEVPAGRGHTGSPEAPIAAARWSSGPTCSGRACAPGGPRCNGSLWIRGNGWTRPRCLRGGGINFDSPTSNSKPFSENVWQHPPALLCCSRTRTFLPALASSTASPSPPTPLPMTMASKFSGTLLARKPARSQVKCV